MITLYSPTNTDFSNNGNATLVPMSCILSMTINGTWVVKMEHPYDPEGRWQLIVQDAVISVDNGGVYLSNTRQFFRIYSIERSLRSVKCEAYPIALDAFNEVVIDEVKANNISGATLAGRLSALPALDDLGYIVSSDITGTATATFKDTNLIAVINGEDVSFAKNWDGEVKYDNKTIYVNNRVDQNLDPIILRLGRDIEESKYSIDSTNVVTRIYPLSNNGYRLNYNEDYQLGPLQYVDSPLIENYPIVHAEFVQTPYMLVTQDEDNEDQEAYIDTMNIYEEVMHTVESFTQDWYDDLETGTGIKTNNEYLQYILNLSEDVEGVSGIWETIYKRYARVLHNSSFKEVIKQAIRAGCQWIDELPTPEYILVDVDVSGVTKTIYCDPSDETKRATTDWVNLEGKWMYFDANGYYDSTKDDTSTWGWWQASGNNYKYYGNKTSGNYLKSQWMEIDGTWYWFNSSGKGRKNKALRTLYTERLITVADNYAELAREHEEDCYQRLYGNMTAFAYDLLSKGVDKPRVTIDVSAIDISNVSEYRNARNIVLGDNVTIITDAFTSNERVVEIEYDCILKQNNKIVLGFPSENLNFIINRNLDTGLVAGEGVTIEGKVINCIGGGGSGGLKYWTETPNTIYQERTYISEDGWSGGGKYFRANEVEWADDYQADFQPKYIYKYKTGIGAKICCWRSYGGYTYPLFASTKEIAVTMYSDDLNHSHAGETYAPEFLFTYLGQDWYICDHTAFVTKWPGIEMVSYGGLPKWDGDNRLSDKELMERIISDYVTQYGYVRAGMGFDDYAYLFWGGESSTDPADMPFKVTQLGDVYCNDVIISDLSTLETLEEFRGISNFTGATSTENGERGYVPAPEIGEREYFLKGNGDWAEVVQNDFTGATSSENGERGLVPQPLVADKSGFLKGDGTWETFGKVHHGIATPTTVGDDGDIYLKEDSSKTEIFSGNQSTSAWASPMTFNCDLSLYQRIRIRGTSGSSFDVYVSPSELVVYTSGASAPALGSYGYVYKNANDTAIMVYSATGHSTTVTNIDAYESTAGFEEAYGKSDGAWCKFPYSKVEITPTLSSGIKIADYEIDGVSGELYAPTGGGGGAVDDVQIDGTSIVDQNGVANIETMSGASASANGTGGLVPQPLIADKEKYLKGDGTWGTPSGGGGGGLTIDTLWTGDVTPNASGTDIQLNANWADYDFLIFFVWQASNYAGTPILMTRDMEIGKSYMATSYSTFGAYVTMKTADTITVKKYGSGTLALTHKKIYGVKI